MRISVNNLTNILRDFKSRVIDKETFNATKTDLEEKINNIDTSNLVDKETFESRGQIYVSNTQPPNMRNGDFWIKQERLLE